MSFFDPLSFGLGAGIGLAVGAGGMYIFKDRLPGRVPVDADSSAKEESASTRDFFSPQSQRRYRQEMTKFFLHRHLPGKQLPITDVLIEPRFLQGRAPVLALEENDEGILIETDLYRVIPMLHQFPSIYAAIQMETLSLQDLETGNPHVAILGLPGSGKSSALAILGLIGLGAISLEDFRDKDRQQFDETEDEKLPQDVRERRQREREEVQLRAIRQLRELQKRDEEVEKANKRDDAVDLDKLFPIYAHLHDIDLNPSHYGGRIDPAEPLVNALHHYVSKTAATVSAPLLYRMLSDGKAIIMVDGFDEVTPQEAAHYHEWIGALRQHYANNLIVITGPATGYDTLVNVGYAPVFIAPLNGLQIETYVNKWLAIWPKQGTLPAENELKSLSTNNRNRSILDLTIKTWATLQGGIHETGRRGFYENYVRRQVDGIDHAEAVLRDAAAYWLDHNHLPPLDALQQIVAKHLGLEVGEIAAEELAEGEEASAKKKAKATKNEGLDKVQKFLAKLTPNPLVHLLPDGTIGFSHPVIGWYLAGETLQQTPPNRLASLAHNPNWHGALSFATAIVDLEPTVLEKVKATPDLLFTNMFSVVDWMPDAPDSLRWKTEILKRLSAAVLAPNQFPAMREYALAALVSARDESGGVAYILRQAIRSGNADLRRVGCLGLGALGTLQAINDLSPMLYDDVLEVQLAAGLALGAIGTEEALTAMTEALLSGDRNLRKVVAEAFAAIPGEGHAILHDGIEHTDLEVRRACAYGLARIPQTWALISIYRTMLEDNEWSVRQAATQAFTYAREPQKIGPQFYPEPVAYEWLVKWASGRGEPVPEGEAGRQVLMMALQSAPSRIRVEAARALGSLSHVGAIKALYQTLTDNDADVRMAAFNALGIMSDRIGRPMPGVA